MSGRQSPRWAFLEWLYIPDSADPTVIYLRRLRIIQTPWFGVYLHWIYLPDRDRDPHDHPWPFTSVILRGGYTEEVMEPWSANPYKWHPTAKTHKTFSAHVMHMWQVHRIRSLQPNTITLIFVGPRRRTWGFWTPEGFVPWTEYINTDGTPKAGPDPFNS